MKNVWSSLLCALLAAALVFFCADFAKAGEKPTRASLFETLQSVSDVHFQLTEKERTKTDMISLLEPYMEHAMAVKYVEANAFPEQAGWIFTGQTRLKLQSLSSAMTKTQKWRRKTEAIPYMNLLEIKTTALFHIKKLSDGDAEEYRRQLQSNGYRPI